MRRCFCISYCANYKWAMALDGIEKKKKISLLFCIYIIVSSSSSFLFALLKETKPRIIAHCFPLIFILRYTSFAFTVYCCVFILYIAKYVKKLPTKEKDIFILSGRSRRQLGPKKDILKISIAANFRLSSTWTQKRHLKDISCG